MSNTNAPREEEKQPLAAPKQVWNSMVENCFDVMQGKTTTQASNSNNVDVFNQINKRMSEMESEIRILKDGLFAIEKDSQTRVDHSKSKFTATDSKDTKEKVESDIDSLKERIEQILTRIHRELSSDRKQVAQRANKSDRLIASVSSQQEETACEVQALTQWRQSISEQVRELQKIMDSGNFQPGGRSGGQPQSRKVVAEIEERVRKQLDPKVTILGQRISSIQQQIAQIRNTNAQEFGRIDNQILTSSNSTKDHVLTIMGQMLSSMDTRLVMECDRNSAKTLSLMDRVAAIEKEMRSEFAMFRQDINELKGVAKSNRDSVELAMSLLSQVEHLATTNRQDLFLYNSSMRDLMKQLFTHLNDKYVQPLHDEVGKVSKNYSRLQRAVKNLLDWRSRL
eukprot:m.56809 g.56809  ORF g.56809 m.56809 type:complete len:396 (+) comp11201_c2_seq2:127-1314(+)